MTLVDLKNRVAGAGNRIFTILGVVAGVAVGVSQYLDLIPPEYRTSKLYLVAAGIVAFGAWWKKNAAPAVLALIVAGSLLPGLARAEDPASEPPYLKVCLVADCGWFIAPTVTFSGAAYDFETRQFVRDFQAGGLIEIQKAGFPVGFAAGVSVQTGEVQGFAASEAITLPGLPGPLKNAAVLAHETFIGERSSFVVGAGYVVRW